MKVLHLFSNSKWTGPAEPALNLCLSLKALGVDIDFACSPGAPGSANRVVDTARERGLEPLLSLGLSKHRHPLKNWADARRLRALLRETPYDLIHCHMGNDQRIALQATTKVPVVRTSYHGLGLPSHEHKLLRKTRFLIEPSAMALEHDRATGLISEERIAVIPQAVDTNYFDPANAPDDGRALLGIPADAFVIGIVARMQRHRHFEDLWEATRQVVSKNPAFHVVVIGRGTYEEEVARKPVAELGLTDHVHFAGFLQGEDYLRALNAMDVKVFLVPGSDGTCRAVREAMAMGKAVVVAERGMLPELVKDGFSGCVCDGSPTQLAEVFAALSQDESRWRRMGEAARQHALEDYSLESQARSTLQVYESITASE